MTAVSPHVSAENCTQVFCENHLSSLTDSGFDSVWLAVGLYMCGHVHK